MQTVHLESLGVEVSRLGFGIMRLPQKDGAIDREAATALVDRAIAGGVNYFDTAWSYHGQQSEAFIGSVLSRYPRDSYHLADKLPLWIIKSKEHAREVFQEQLRRCGVDRFDFYLLHSVDADRWQRVVDLGLLDLMDELRAAGKIRFLGFSFHDSPQVLAQVLDHRPWDFAQIQLNYLDDVMLSAGTLYDMLAARGIPCMVMEPVKGGSLGILPPTMAELLEACPHPQAKRWPHPAQWAFRWCMSKPGVHVILSGMSTMQQVEQNLELFAQARPLADEELQALALVRDRFLAVKTIPCTACGYCSICPKEVAIPRIFDIYNRFKLFRNDFRAAHDSETLARNHSDEYWTKTDYAMLTPAHTARACISCGKCVPLCPQQIAIPDRLREVHDVIVSLPAVLQEDTPAI